GITELSDLPFLSGEVTRNGVGRYAVVVVVYSFVRLLTYKKILRYFFLIFSCSLRVYYFTNRISFRAYGAGDYHYDCFLVKRQLEIHFNWADIRPYYMVVRI
ncbi:MAG: hypothetical protein PHT41_06955, partial [Candidatus Omnitrophica bacterium]|nr:hypothetical protein [Candidatus Omnitrophota bacterium]